MLVEILPLGVVTRIYEKLADNALRKKIAVRFSLPLPVFISWLTVIALTRNACCHHARVWNKKNPIPPHDCQEAFTPLGKSFGFTQQAFFDICIIKWFVDIMSPHNGMKGHLQQLLADFPMIDIKAMDFPTNWQEEPL